MSKKKKKTRSEKNLTTHNFSHLKENKQKEAVVGENEEASNAKSLLDPVYVSDLKRVLAVIGLVVIGIIILSYVIYRTDILNPLLSKYGLKY